MLDAEFIRARILEALPGSEVEVRDYTGTGDHYEARVVSPDFAGKAMVQQHQLVYAPLQQWLKSGELHALALKTYSPEQWKKLGTR
ncbi:BolA/YrbA family protein [Myxococcus xanthus DK 1622]|uniref:BolA/YrbA family protein n=5 Tax=Myxococcaceae TaxID=31 RepID=Q1DAS1_MYXXD|nr:MULTISPECIES: BolA/IbaG family iron-sulfur metabolism protein [Myxococcaceae]ABF88006.1 BolA/YrbA family protein [Myxococcus xanthus DK 1622]AEI65478.1 BolA/YrbA family protein [Corallococcus macrosporus]ATB46474.1 BolA family transcriptional regulator [Corallococcus macrosporus DSM 14697]NOJ57192.1 BolA/IbaG family iron-sulfur metabolism protein [Myxococcus xanthus]NOJ78977.1 BolA/IbaG family iron-sulfur metabolism protein [Myxococcus xanthus]